MAADSFDGDDEGLRRGHGGAPHDPELADRHSRPVVHGVGALDREALEHPVVDHRLRPRAAFLRRLEAEDERAVEFAVFGEPARRAEQHRRVAVVTAGVHAARRGRGIFGAARLDDRQGVHVGAKQNALVRAPRRAFRAVQDAEDAGLADAFDDLVEAELAQALGDDARRARHIVHAARGGGGNRAAIR